MQKNIFENFMQTKVEAIFTKIQTSPRKKSKEDPDGIRDAQESRGLGDVYKRQILYISRQKLSGFYPATFAKSIYAKKYL